MNSLYCVGVIVLALFCCVVSSVHGCGGLLTAFSVTEGSISSPNYPAAYPNYTRCIWLIEAPSLYQVVMNITFAGESVNSKCSDYIEVRDGSILANLQLSTCAPLSSYKITSSASWMWLFFKSDGIGATTGLTATYSAVYAGNAINNITSPIAKCNTYQFLCSNKECISTSYKCDGYNDCGCADEDCDESGCQGETMSLGVMYAIGSSLGVVLFLAVCMGTYFYERKFHWAHIKKMETNGNR